MLPTGTGGIGSIPCPMPFQGTACPGGRGDPLSPPWGAALGWGWVLRRADELQRQKCLLNKITGGMPLVGPDLGSRREQPGPSCPLGVTEMLGVPARCGEQHPEVSAMEVPTLVLHPWMEPREGLVVTPSRGKQRQVSVSAAVVAYWVGGTEKLRN